MTSKEWIRHRKKKMKRDKETGRATKQPTQSDQGGSTRCKIKMKKVPAEHEWPPLRVRAFVFFGLSAFVCLFTAAKERIVASFSFSFSVMVLLTIKCDDRV